MHARITIIVALPYEGQPNVADDIVARLFPAFTRTLGRGVWEGEHDEAVVYTIFEPYGARTERFVELTAKALAVAAGQEAVLAHIEIVTPPFLVGKNGRL